MSTDSSQKRGHERPHERPEGIVVWGAKGHALVLAELAATLGITIVALVDNDPSLASPIESIPVLRGLDGLDRWNPPGGSGPARGFAVAIGGGGGKDRLAIADRLGERGLVPVTLIHPRAYVAPTATVADGVQVLAGSVVATHVIIGRQCIVNTSSSVDHESVIADGVHVGPGATVCGCVAIGEQAFVGAGAVVLPGISIGARAIVGAGAVVTRDVPEATVVAGNPALPIRPVDEVRSINGR